MARTKQSARNFLKTVTIADPKPSMEEMRKRVQQNAFCVDALQSLGDFYGHCAWDICEKIGKALGENPMKLFNIIAPLQEDDVVEDDETEEIQDVEVPIVKKKVIEEDEESEEDIPIVKKKVIEDDESEEDVKTMKTLSEKELDDFTERVKNFMATNAAGLMSGYCNIEGGVVDEPDEDEYDICEEYKFVLPCSGNYNFDDIESHMIENVDMEEVDKLTKQMSKPCMGKWIEKSVEQVYPNLGIEKGAIKEVEKILKDIQKKCQEQTLEKYVKAMPHELKKHAEREISKEGSNNFFKLPDEELSRLLEYICAEVVEIAGNIANDGDFDNECDITKQHILEAIAKDEDLNALINDEEVEEIVIKKKSKRANFDVVCIDCEHEVGETECCEPLCEDCKSQCSGCECDLLCRCCPFAEDGDLYCKVCYEDMQEKQTKGLSKKAKEMIEKANKLLNNRKDKSKYVNISTGRQCANPTKKHHSDSTKKICANKDDMTAKAFQKIADQIECVGFKLSDTYEDSDDFVSKCKASKKLGKWLNYTTGGRVGKTPANLKKYAFSVKGFAVPKDQKDELWDELIALF